MLFDLFQGGIDSTFFVDLLMRLPGIILALSLHEAAHAFVAYRCGDPTAKDMGRLTLNPLKHIDPIGFLMMVLVRIGWAKPVPVNPNNFKNPRRDDLLVSIAGITANILQFLVGGAIMYGIVAYALQHISGLGYGANSWFEVSGGLMTLKKACFLYPWAAKDVLIVPVLGTAMGYVYEMLINYVFINISLALFNLLPIPPLDGYHVLNDLVLKRSLFADIRVQQIGRVIIYALAFTGALSTGLGYVIDWVLGGTGQAALALFNVLT